MSGRLEGRRVLVTHADRYIGPPVVELFREEGANVIADQSEYADPGVIQNVVDEAGRIDCWSPTSRDRHT
jgi:2-keto-3-deoxy-L-fuconate dehydrogenase